MPDVAIVAVAPGQRIACLDDLVVAHLGSAATEALATALSDHGKACGAPARLGLLYYVERGGIGVPGAEARSAFVELSRTSAPYYVASTFVIPGGGMAAATAHAFIGGVRALSGGRLPLAVFGELLPAIGWLRQSVPQRTKLPSDEDIEALVARMRASG